MKLIFVVGPTCSGKTEWSIKYQETNKERVAILNADSIQIYKDLNIGSSKPDFEKYKHIPHYLFDEVEAPRTWTAFDYRERALSLLHDLDKKKELDTCLIVGGSGFYIRALEKGMYPIQKVPSAVVKELESKQTEELYQELRDGDLEYARSVSEKDRYRIIRALGIIKHEGKTISEIKQEFKPQPLPWKQERVCIEISRPQLKTRIEARVGKMIEQGLIEETEQMFKLYPSWKPLRSVGYKECVEYIQDKKRKTKSQLAEEIVKSTLLLAKHQKTWFKKN